MPGYLQFDTEDGSFILVETEVEEISPPQGTQKAGLKEKVHAAVAVAQETFERAFMQVLRCNARVLVSVIKSLEDPPQEAEITFGLKATGEVGNFVITKATGEMNYGIKLVWRTQPQAEAPQDETDGPARHIAPYRGT